MPDYSHTNCEHYLENNYFIPAGEGGNRKYWAHVTNNMVPTTVSTTLSKGLFNVFPLDLSSLDAKTSSSSSLGKANHHHTSPPPPPLLVVTVIFFLLCAQV